MEEDRQTLILEILKNGAQLKMSLSQQEDLAQTVRQYSQVSVSFEDIRRICEAMTQALNKCSSVVPAAREPLQQLRSNGQLLWEQLLSRPVRERLKKTSIRNLVLAIDEELVPIPWELLFDGERFLALGFDLGRVIRTVRQHESLPRYRSPVSRLRMLILANPTNDLHAAYQEGLDIRNQFDRARERITIDFKSTFIDTLYVKKILREYDIVHFAGHCEYDKADPGVTGWVLQDGRLSAHDIVTMAGSALLPSLIFSNGCQSAQVSPDTIEQDYQEKTYSLASAFLYGGVRHYIGSVQRIEDRVSFSFAKEFYSRLIKGSSVGESLRMARLQSVKDHGPDSVLWASYLLYGDPGFSLFGLPAPRPKHPARTFVKLLRTHRRSAVIALATAAIVIGAFAAARLLPSLTPTSYYRYAQAERSFNTGKNAEAVSLLDRLLSRDPRFLQGYPLIAEACERMGKSQEALRYYFEYSLQSQAKNDAASLAASYNLLGWFYHRSGNYPKAFDFYAKALAVSREHRDPLNEATALRRTALWYRDKNELDKALELLTKSAEINREHPWSALHRYNLACDYFDLGLVFVDKDDYDSAKNFYTKSRTIFERMHLKKELSDYYFNLGEVYLMEKEYARAMDYYRKGLSIDELQDNRPAIAQDLAMIAELYVEMDNSLEAERFLKRAETIARQINALPELASISFDLGLLYKKNGQKNKAREYLRQAQEIYRNIDTPDARAVQRALLTIDNQ